MVYPSPISVYEFDGEERVTVYGGGPRRRLPSETTCGQFSLKGTDTEHYGAGQTPPPKETLGPGGE